MKNSYIDSIRKITEQNQPVLPKNTELFLEEYFNTFKPEIETAAKSGRNTVMLSLDYKYNNNKDISNFIIGKELRRYILEQGFSIKTEENVLNRYDVFGIWVLTISW